jgi:hypothetical protein
VIEKGIRDRLGVQPGWKAVQHLVDGHVEIHFVPPEHARSLAGRLSRYARPELATDDALAVARAAAWADAARRREEEAPAGEAESE